MSKDFLFEIGLEEMPAHVVTPSMNQLKEKTAKFLKENTLAFDSIDCFSTPRRLAIRVNGLADKQADIDEEVKGPAKKIALDEQGNWTKAAEGFARGQGVATEAIFFKEIKGVEYVHVNKFISGKPTEEVLLGMKDVMTSLTFPVSMHWGSFDFKYIRPIHWIIALLDDKVLPIQLLDVKAGRESRGHRFLGHETTIENPREYEEKLKEQFVMVDPVERKNIIIKQAELLAKENNWTLDLEKDLLEEVNNLVEYPTAFVGSFDEKYLSVPEEVLVTSMKEHQRYFDIRTQEGKLLPYFISVRNGNAEHIENVVKGNEKVLTARLEDAEFFFAEDKKLSIEECVEKLKHVTFHEKIGTMYEKMKRVKVIAEILGKKVGIIDTEMKELQRAAEIYKFDLVTNMVGEFPELQGIMGEKYALIHGESQGVAQSIREHYQPVSSEGALPESTIGAILAVADKLDSVLCFFNAGMVPSGSNDPYALRRQTYGIVRIVENQGWNFPIMKIQKEIIETINQDIDEYGVELREGELAVSDFIKARMKQWLSTKQVRYDIIDAVIQSDQDDLSTMFEAALLLKDKANAPDFKPSVEALTRVMNLATKAKEQFRNENTITVSPDLFENEAEKELFKAVEEVETNFANKTLGENYEALKNLFPLIENYFDTTMVMVDNHEVKENRMKQLVKIARLVLTIAKLDLLIVK